MKHSIKYFITACLLAFFSSCSNNEPHPVRSDLEYFPLKKGVYQLYQVEETQYTVVEGPVTQNYQLMTEVTDSFPSTGGGTTYVIYRSIRIDETDSWQYLDTWSVKANENAVVVDEGTTSYVKLAFPARTGKVWDGNFYNANGEDEYTFKSVGTTISVNATSYDDCVDIIQNDYQDPIVSVDVRREVYARGVGLVLKEVNLLNYCTDVDCLGKQEIETGTVLKQEIIEYGVR